MDALFLIPFILGILITSMAHKVIIDCFYKNKYKCTHKRFTIDNQIRTIECNECGLRSWLDKEPRDLYR